jgi:hypothetical protein
MKGTTCDAVKEYYVLAACSARQRPRQTPRRLVKYRRCAYTLFPPESTYISHQTPTVTTYTNHNLPETYSMNASTSMTEPQNAKLGDKRRADDDDISDRNIKTMKITHDGDVPDVTIDAPASDDEKDVSKATRRKLAAKKVSKTHLMVPSATLPEDLKLIGDVPAPPAFLKARKEALSAQAGDGDAAAVLLATPTPSARTAEADLQPGRSSRTRKTVQYPNKTTLPLDPVTPDNADPKEGAELPATKRAPAKPRKTRAKATSTSSPENVPNWLESVRK